MKFCFLDSSLFDFVWLGGFNFCRCSEKKKSNLVFFMFWLKFYLFIYVLRYSYWYDHWYLVYWNHCESFNMKRENNSLLHALKKQTKKPLLLRSTTICPQQWFLTLYDKTLLQHFLAEFITWTQYVELTTYLLSVIILIFDTHTDVSRLTVTYQRVWQRTHISQRHSYLLLLSWFNLKSE